MDETKKNNYSILKNNIINIKNSLESLDYELVEVTSNLKSSIIIDKNVIGKSELHQMDNKVNDVIGELNNIVIPIINRNINY